MPARKRMPGIPRELAAIVERCLQKDPGQRYASAAALRDDLYAWLDRRPVSARPLGTVQRTWRRVRREPWKATAVAATFVGLLVFAGSVGFWMAQRDVLSAGEKALELERLEDLSLRAWAWMRLDETEAGAAFERILAEYPKNREARVGLALARGDSPGALDQDPHEPIDCYLEAQRLAFAGPRGSTDSALRAAHYARRAIMSAPHARSAYLASMGNASVMAGDSEGAREAADSLVRLWPDSPIALYWAGYALLESDTTRAVELFDRALLREPELFVARADRANAYNLLGRYDDARRELSALVEIRPSNARAWMSLGHAEGALGLQEEALNSLRRAITEDPRLPGAHYNLGLTLSEVDCAAAAEAFEKATELDAAFADAWFNLGTMSYRIQDWKSAAKAFRSACDLEPEDARTHRSLASALTRLGRVREAIEAQRRAVELAPDSPEDHDFLCELLQHIGEGDALEAERRRFAAIAKGGETP